MMKHFFPVAKSSLAITRDEAARDVINRLRVSGLQTNVNLLPINLKLLSDYYFVKSSCT